MRGRRRTARRPVVRWSTPSRSWVPDRDGLRGGWLEDGLVVQAEALIPLAAGVEADDPGLAGAEAVGLP